MKPILIAISLIAACAAGAQTNAASVLRVNIPAAVDVTRVQIVSVAQPTANVWVVQMAYTTRQNLAGRIGVEVWVQSVASISVTVTRAEIAALLGVAPEALSVSVPVGSELGIPQTWVPALMQKVGIAMNPYASQRYANGLGVQLPK